MKYRVQSDLILDEEDTAEKAFKYLKRMRRLFRTINEGKPNEEKSHLSWHRCYHDEEPAKPCEFVETVESE